MGSLAVAAASAFAIVFVAELGDKTQLLAVGFGTRLPLRVVAVGLFAGYAAANAVAAVVGGLLGATLPDRPIAIVGGVLFLVFAVLALRGEDHPADGDVVTPRTASTPRAVATIALTILIAEMGDKTQLATAALATRSNPVAVWVGATLGVTSAGLVGAIAGRHLGHLLEPGVIRIASAALFALFGVVLLASAV